eukprot:6459130-Amphidinium_carterae.1
MSTRIYSAKELHIERIIEKQQLKTFWGRGFKGKGGAFPEFSSLRSCPGRYAETTVRWKCHAHSHPQHPNSTFPPLFLTDRCNHLKTAAGMRLDCHSCGLLLWTTDGRLT